MSKIFIKKEVVHYVGKIQEIVSETKFKVCFFFCNVKNTNKFVFPIVDIEALVDLSDIVMPLPKPFSVCATNRTISTLFISVLRA
jgi:hypothetical protein